MASRGNGREYEVCIKLKILPVDFAVVRGAIIKPSSRSKSHYTIILYLDVHESPIQLHTCTFYIGSNKLSEICHRACCNEKSSFSITIS